jgi:twitching motility protein PilT
MSLVPSLLQAILRVDGEALVMHAGDKPYVVSPTGQVELASRGLTLDALNTIVGQLLPTELQTALDEFGAVQYELPAAEEFPGEHFTVVAARGGDDVWTEIRRRRMPDDDQVPEELFGPSGSAPAAAALPVLSPPAAAPAPAFAQSDADDLSAETLGFIDATEQTLEEEDDVLLLPDASQLWPEQPRAVEVDVGSPAGQQSEGAFDIDIDIDVDADVALEPPPPARPVADLRPPWPAPELIADLRPPSPAAELIADLLAPSPALPQPVADLRPPSPELPQRVADLHPPAPVVSLPIATEAPPAVIEQPAEASIAPPRPAQPRVVPPSQPAVVLPISRSPVRSDQPPPLMSDPTLSGLERLLRVSAARGASTLYLSSESRPSVRVDGQLQMLDGEPVHVARDVESLLLTLMPERSHEALRTGGATEWICDIEGVGRVRCMSFRDHRGPGGVFRLMPTRSISAEQLGLPRQVQALAIEPEGIVLVAGPRSSGKRTLISAFVDLVNRTRRDHVITIEREINIVHERGNSFISQREMRGDDDEMLAAARAALREDPDVLVIEDLRTGALMNVALEAAAAGRLVIGGFSAHTATGAIDRIIDLYAPEYRRQVQLALADSLRGVIVQVLLRKIGGGRLPAREVLLNTPAVSSVIAEGKTSQLPMAIEGGRRYGMMPLNDALVGLVQSGAVEAHEAYRRSTDRPGFLAALDRQGIDTSFVERLG